VPTSSVAIAEARVHEDILRAAKNPSTSVV
jgi:hypothetical protein